MKSVRSRARILGFVVGGVLPVAVHAQVIISGFVRDSLSSTPLAGAILQLVPAATPWAAGRTARTDSIGRYRIDSVPGGNYLLGFQHPRLDTLGLDAITRQLDIAPFQRIVRADLAIPSGRTFVASLCDGKPDSAGAVIGRVFNADETPLTRGSVSVRWGEMRAGVGGVRRVPVTITAAFGADGRYVACGLPTDAPMLVSARATAGTDTTRIGTSGDIELTFAAGNPLLHRNLYIAFPDTTTSTIAGAPASARRARTGTARLSGRVLGAKGAPVAGARVSIQDTDITAVTDSAGAFRVAGLPSGTRAVEVIAIGYQPLRSAADLRPNRETVVTFTATATVTTLGAVNVTGIKRDRAGFGERRASGRGFFLDGNAIEQRGSQSISQALIMAPTLKGNGYDQQNPTRPLISGRANCTPTAYVDGQRMNDGLAGVDNLLTVRRVGGIEVYGNPAEAPAQFRSMDGSCAVILVWTRAYVP